MIKTIRNIAYSLSTRLSRENKKIIISFITVSLFLFVGKLSGAAKEMAIAWRFGVSTDVDAYSLVFNLMIWPVSIWFSVLSVILIPLLAKIRHQSPEALSLFKAQVFGLTIIVGIGLMLLANLGFPALIQSHWLGLPSQTAAIAVTMIPEMSSYIVIGSVISLLSVWTMSYGKHANTLLECLPAMLTFFGVLLMAGNTPLIWGLIIGALIQMILLFVPLYKQKRVEWPNFRFNSVWWPDFRHVFFMLLFGQILISSTTLIDQFFSAGLTEGTISSLNYSNKILALILGLSATAINRAGLPVFSQGKIDGIDVKKMALNWTKLVFIATVVFSLSFYFLTEPVIRFLFERGAFTAQDTLRVSQLLKISLAGLPFYISTIMLVTFLASHGKQHVLAQIAMTGFFIKILFCFLLVSAFDVYGLLIATIIGQVISFGYACYASNKVTASS